MINKAYALLSIPFFLLLIASFFPPLAEPPLHFNYITGSMGLVYGVAIVFLVYVKED